jgi:hypothetical protein
LLEISKRLNAAGFLWPPSREINQSGRARAHYSSVSESVSRKTSSHFRSSSTGGVALNPVSVFAELKDDISEPSAMPRREKGVQDG